MEKDDRLWLCDTGGGGELLDVDLVVGQVARRAVHVSSPNIKEIAVVQTLAGLAAWGNGIDADT